MSVPFGLLLSWRRLTGPDRVLSILTIIAIAACVTLAAGLEMASRSAQSQLARTADALLGSAKIEVVAGTVGVPEQLLETIRSTPGVRAASAMLSARLRLHGRDFPLEVIGVDFLAEEEVRTATIRAGGVRVRDPLRLMAKPNAIVVTDALLKRMGLSDDSPVAAAPTIEARFGGRDVTLSVQGVLEGGGIAEAYGGQIAAMDVYALQEITNRRGWFDRIDVVPRPDQDVDALLSLLRERIRGVADARPAAFHMRDATEMLSAIRMVVILFTGMVTIVAGLIAYAALTLFTDLQRGQLFVLRASGMEAERAQRGLMLDVSVVAWLGTVAGALGAWFISEPLLAVLSEFLVESVGTEKVGGVSIQASTISVTLLSGLLPGMVGGTAAARRVGRRYLLDVLEPTRVEPQLASRFLFAGSGVGLLGLGMLTFAPIPPFGRVAIAFGTGCTVVLCLSRCYPSVAAFAAGPWSVVSPSMGHLTGRFFTASPWVFAIVVTAIAASTASLSGLFLMLTGLENTVVQWSTSLAAGSTSVRAGSAMWSPSREVLTPQTLNLVRTTPGVLAVSENQGLLSYTLFRGEEVSLNASTMDVVGQYGRLAAVDRPEHELARALMNGAVAISTNFARRFGIAAGDRIRLRTRQGETEFEVAGLIRDFGLPAGTILMDIGTYDAHFHRPGTWSASVWTVEPREEVLAAIRARVDQQDLFFVDAATYIAAQRSLAEQFMGPLRVISAFVAIMSGVGVAVALLGTLARRRRELALIRAAGAEPYQVVALMLTDSALLTVVGVFLGLLFGYALSPTMTEVLRATSGWDVEQSWFSPAVPIAAFGAIAVALVAAALPARMAYRSLPREVLAPE